MMLVPRSWQKRDLVAALERLEAEATGGVHLLGHNILRHDLPHLFAVRPGLANILRSPIDTLWLNPLAFPRNPYHHLVKHYHDGRLQASHVNDPELDARLVFQVLRNQLTALRQQNADQPDAVAAFHFLTTRMENPGRFDAVFREVRGLLRPILLWQRSDFPAPGGARLRAATRSDAEPPFQPAARLANGVCFVLDPGRGRGFRHAALGTGAVPRGCTDRAAPPRHQLQ